MNDNVLNQMDRPLREAFRSIPDELFNDHPEVLAAKQRLTDINHRHSEAVKPLTRLNARLDELDTFCASVPQQKAERLESLASRVADMLESGCDLSSLRPLRQEIDDLEVTAEIIKSARQTLANRQRAMGRAVAALAEYSTSANEHLVGILDRLKLEEAIRRIS